MIGMPDRSSHAWSSISHATPVKALGTAAGLCAGSFADGSSTRSGVRACVVAVQMAFMLMERNSGNSTIDYPIDGSRGIVDALVRGIEKYGGRVMLRARVEEVLVEGGYAALLLQDAEKIFNPTGTHSLEL